MRNRINTSLILVFLTASSNLSLGQAKSGFEVLGSTKSFYKPEIDSTININNLSASAYYELIDKLFIADQKYRDSVMVYWGIKTEDLPLETQIKVKHYWKMIKINDQANQTILLRLLKQYGWPKGKGASEKAWFIVWHCRNEEESKFFKYLEDAVSSSLLKVSYLENLPTYKRYKAQSVR